MKTRQFIVISILLLSILFSIIHYGKTVHDDFEIQHEQIWIIINKYSMNYQL